MSPKLRPIELADSDAFSELMLELAHETPNTLLTAEEYQAIAASQVNRTRYLIESPRELVLIAETKKKPVGFIALTQGAFQRNAHVAGLMIGVRKDFWRQGIATALLQSAKQWVEERKIQRVEFTVMENNHRALQFYLQQGFRQEGIRTNSIKIDGILLNEISMSWILR